MDVLVVLLHGLIKTLRGEVCLPDDDDEVNGSLVRLREGIVVLRGRAYDIEGRCQLMAPVAVVVVPDNLDFVGIAVEHLA